jgi:DNA-binding SARP family transcriptional activator
MRLLLHGSVERRLNGGRTGEADRPVTSTRFLLLGPLQVVRGGQDIPVRRGKLRALLAMLLLGSGRVVPAERLINGLWPEGPPDTAVKTLQTYVSQLRTLLEPDRGAGTWGEMIVTEHTGYRLRVDAGAVDAHRFGLLVEQANGLTWPDPAAAREILAEALRLWRGPALADFADEAFAETEIVRLEELRLTAVEQRVAADLALGRHELVVAELRELVRHHPLRETLWEHLMVALYRGGQQAQALRAYQEARRILGDELGLSPGPALERTQERILHHDLTLSTPSLPRDLAPRADTDHKITEEGSGGGGPGAERRRATVLHADLTAVAVGAALLDALRREVIRFGGTVIEASDHAFAAVFGAPVTHEDDPERAVSAGMAIRRRIHGFPDPTPENGPGAAPARAGVRIGVDTGEVDTGPGADGYMVSGPAATAAASIVARAASGQVLVCPATYEATRRGVRYAAIPSQGKLMDLWQVVAVPEEPSRRPVSTTPLVGRTAELRLLDSVWTRVCETRSPYLVTMTGAAGIGKSRLAGELVDRLAEEGATVLHGRCLPYGEAMFGPLAGLLRQIAGVSENDSIRTVRWRMREWLETHLPEGERDRIDEYLVTVLSLLGDIGGNRTSTIALLRRVMEVVAAERPTVLVLDDVHWAHAETLDAVETLAARVRSVALMIVVLSRPELFTARPGWGGGMSSHTTLTVEALPADQSYELACLLLDPRTDDASEVAAIDAAAGGNPLFVEELAAWYAEGHDVATELPATVRGVIGARLDTLPPAERRVVVDAAAVGHTFWGGALSRLESAAPDQLPDLLDSLEMRGIFVRRPESSIGDDPGLAFRHALIAEAAYDLIPPDARPLRHLAIAEYLEAKGAHGPAPAALAHHWKEAGDLDRAVTCLEEAGDAANTGWERDRAAALYQQAMELIVDTDTARWRAINGRRAVALMAWAHGVMDLGQRPEAVESPPDRYLR